MRGMFTHYGDNVLFSSEGVRGARCSANRLGDPDHLCFCHGISGVGLSWYIESEPADGLVTSLLHLLSGENSQSFALVVVAVESFAQATPPRYDDDKDDDDRGDNTGSQEPGERSVVGVIVWAAGACGH